MPRVEKTHTENGSFRAFLDEQMKDPEFAREYEALGPEFEIISQVIALRNKRKMTQAQLAKRVGTAQPSIARLESRGGARNLDFLRRVADALDARVEVRLVPREASRSKGTRSTPSATGHRASARSLKST